MSVLKTTDSEFKTLLAENEKVVVKYYADWCGSCRLFTPKFNRLSDDERFKDIVFLDVNAEQNAEARKMAGVSNLPFFAVFKNGNLIEGATTSKEEYLVEMLQKLN
jgi:thiol-disulfide isomerase/thioredoxin